MGKYDPMILPKREQYRRRGFGEAFSAGLGESLGRLPANVLSEGFSGLADYIVGSGLRTRDTEEDAKQLLNKSNVVGFEGEAPKEAVAYGTHVAGKALSENDKDASQRAMLSPDARLPDVSAALGLGQPENPARRSMALAGPNKGKSTPSFGGAPGAVDVINQTNPGAIEAETSLNRSISESSRRVGEAGSAEGRVFRDAGSAAPKSVYDYLPEAQRQNPHLQMDGGQGQITLMGIARRMANADLSRRAAMGRPEAIAQLQTSGKNQADIAQSLGASQHNVASAPAQIAKEAMGNKAALDKLSMRGMRRGGPAMPDLQKIRDAADQADALYRIKEAKHNSTQWADDDARQTSWDDLQKAGYEARRLQALYDKGLAKNPDAVVSPRVALSREDADAKAKATQAGKEQLVALREQGRTAAAKVVAAAKTGAEVIKLKQAQVKIGLLIQKGRTDAGEEITAEEQAELRGMHDELSRQLGM